MFVIKLADVILRIPQYASPVYQINQTCWRVTLIPTCKIIFLLEMLATFPHLGRKNVQHLNAGGLKNQFILSTTMTDHW